MAFSLCDRRVAIETCDGDFLLVLIIVIDVCIVGPGMLV